MSLTLAVASVVLRTMSMSIDTTLAVRPDDRLDLTNARGSIHIKVWDRPSVRIQADLNSSDALQITQTGAILRVIARSHAGTTRPIWLDTAGMRIRIPSSGRPLGAVDYEVTVPRTLSVVVSGLYTSVTVDSVRGAVDVGVYHGDITVTAGASVRLEGYVGTIVVDRGNGRVDVRSLNGEIIVRRTTGDIDAKSVNGAVSLLHNLSERAVGVSYSERVMFRGSVSPRGRYELITQSGAVLVHLRAGADVVIEAAVAPERIHACTELPKPGTGPPSRRRFTFGSGSAVLSVDSFSGSFELCFDDRPEPADSQ